ncbi:MAG: DUF2848 family protein [Tissierellia bacterium]|nr:DUF2848 family protein [Tissierellia bacterium]
MWTFFIESHESGKVEKIEVASIPTSAMGFTARNQEQMRKNLKALEDSGISYPSSFPQIYPCQRNLLTTDSSIEVVAPTTCGEVEYVILRLDGDYYIGVGSDHADKELEKVSIINSKQVCSKPFVEKFWKYSEVRPHWDDMILRSYQRLEDGQTILYQEGSVKDMLHPDEIIKELSTFYKEEDDYLVFSGSIANLIGRFEYGDEFIYELEDPVWSRSIKGKYEVVNINKR